MQQFPVPKYIDLEAHILGPLSISQTVTVILAGAIIMISYLFLETFLFIPAAVVLGITAMIISFGRVNGRPMSDFLFNVFSYNINPHVYVWALADKKVVAEQKKTAKQAPKGGEQPRATSTVTPEQIHALAEQMDVLKNKIPSPNDQ